MAIEQKDSLHRSIRTLFGVGRIGGLSDGQLLERFLSRRDEVAFEALVARLGPMVLDVCRNVLSDSHDVEDAFQATFLILASRATSIRSQDSLGSWLFGVARRVACRLKADTARRRAHERSVAEMTSEWTGRGEPAPDHAGLHEEIGKLPAKYREPVVLCYLEGMTYEAAAGQLRCPLGTVSVRLKRAKERLRSGLTRRGLAVPAGLPTAGVGYRAASAATPCELMELTVQTAIKGAASVGGILPPIEMLTRRVMNAMLMTKLMTGAGAGLLLLAVLTLGMRGFADPGPPDPSVGKEEAKGGLPPAKETVVTDKAVASDRAMTVAFSPDGRTVASGGMDSTVRLWDVATGEKRSTLKGHAGCVRSVAFAPDGKVVASVGDDQYLRLWDAASGDLKGKQSVLSAAMRGIASWAQVNTIAFSPDGKSVVTGAVGKEPASELRLIDVETGRMHWGHIGRGYNTLSVAFASDGKTLASAGPTGVRIWDSGTGDITRILTPDPGEVFGVSLSPDGKLLAGVGRCVDKSGRPTTGLVIVWETRTGEVRWRQEAISVMGRAVAFSPDGKSVAIGGFRPWTVLNEAERASGTKVVSEVKLWDGATGIMRWTWEGGVAGSGVGSLAFSPDGKTLVVCDDDSVGLINAETGKTERTLTKTTTGPK